MQHFCLQEKIMLSCQHLKSDKDSFDICSIVRHTITIPGKIHTITCIWNQYKPSVKATLTRMGDDKWETNYPKREYLLFLHSKHSRLIILELGQIQEAGS
mmetsp:Transcript_10606/g.17202  ORF Transcript_10606/g.17202 Transcript_10606/m.17202 type:complete len:100 (-) Transcript_10606:382-681(-)